MAKSVLMDPVKVGRQTFKNRIVMTAMETRMSTPTGDVTQNLIDYYAARARGGAAAIVVENTFVDSIASRSSLASSGLNTDQLISGKYRLAEAIKDGGAKAILQISHGGLQANAAAVPGQEALAPSAQASKFVGRMPRALEHDEIVAIEDAFAQAARRAKQAGFDGVEVHGAHGYLICEFLSPYTNHRTDEYGGSFENRLRFLQNILRKVREQVGRDFIVGVRLSGEEKVEGGLTIADTTKIGQAIQSEVDYINVSVGNYETMATWMISPLYRPAGAIVDLAAAMRAAVNVPVLGCNALTAKTGEKAVEEGKCDLVGYARPLLADPEMPNKVAEGRYEDIRPCMRGHEGCISLFFRGCPIRCEVNGQAGHEREYKIVPVANPRNVVVVGGGMAGMEAARVAAEYGHKVTLIERSDHLGGHFVEACAPSFKYEARGVLEYLRRQVEKSTADVRLGTEATPELVRSLGPDALVLAVGSDYIKPPIRGIESSITGEDALLGHKPEAGSKVVVIGGGLVGAETALELGRSGCDVTVLEMLEDIVMQDEPLSRIALKLALKEAGVKVVTSAKVTAIEDGAVSYEHEGATEQVSADTVVAALGLGSRSKVVESLKGACPETYVIGDAVRGRKLFNCTHDAWVAVRKISGVE
ncbi:MAG: FAD-dependent oxidoreductase [Tractidigestivibacter sp.]|jgi:2,4-dienoyl-CoA reductase-like NADH-dependent reductase (Old Yellow Enzyme family)/thioredoxin reductase|uniref:FAD-dependent oxidoreductase n=1 Tax=Tractidigestivibacter sp. TaxID=2847320 RepID=UPI003D93F5EA